MNSHKPAHRILAVDDDVANQKLLSVILESLGHEVVIAQDSIEAMQKLKPDIDAVLLDVMLPGTDGFETASQIRRQFSPSELPIIMVTALSSKADRLRAVESGADDFVAKPIDRLELQLRLSAALARKDLYDDLRRHKDNLQRAVEDRTSALREALREIAESQKRTQVAHLETVHRLAIASGYKDEDTAQHIRRISGYCGVIARGFKLPPEEVDLIRNASPMHDVGKIGIPDHILLKPGKLDPEEWTVMKQHTTIGAKILGGSSSEVLKAGEVIALTHHEKWDGSGYPRGLSGGAIPLWSRICAVADVFDALTSERPYKQAFTNSHALDILREGRGHHFDPNCIDIFFDNLGEIETIQHSFRESENTFGESA